jgi:hypothetical protein
MSRKSASGFLGLFCVFLLSQCTPSHNHVGAVFQRGEWKEGVKTRLQARQSLGEPARIVSEACEEFASHDVLTQETTLVTLCFQGKELDATLVSVDEKKMKLLLTAPN